MEPSDAEMDGWIGEAAFAGALVAGIWTAAVRKGWLRRDEAIETIDALLLQVESGMPKSMRPAAMIHKCRRLEDLLTHLQQIPIAGTGGQSTPKDEQR